MGLMWSLFLIEYLGEYMGRIGIIDTKETCITMRLDYVQKLN
jgi:hypothetical protein